MMQYALSGALGHDVWISTKYAREMSNLFIFIFDAALKTFFNIAETR